MHPRSPTLALVALLSTLSTAPALGQTRLPPMPRGSAPGTASAPVPGPARPPPKQRSAAPGAMSATERAAALAEISAALRQSYVFPEKVAGIVDHLEQARKSGRYDTDDAEKFAEHITADLHAASKDGHLYLVNDPGRYAFEKQRATEAPSEAGAEDDPFLRRATKRDHHGLTELKVLPGNLRYLKISGFEWIRDETGTLYDEALRFLRDGDAVIIDLRGNGGGDHAAVNYLVSHFLDGDQLEMTFLAGSKPPKQSRTLEHLPAGRLKGKPLYVLIDGGVASAGEAFAYDVQQFKLGTLVGAKTAGAANNNRFVPVAPGFVLSVSFGHPVHPVSNGNWEGSGVAPTVEAPPLQALEVAQSLALERLAKSPDASPEDLADYEWARIAVEARLHPSPVAPARLKSLAGRYGEIHVELRDGSLWMGRPNRPTWRLVPLTAEGLFGADGNEMLRVRFTQKGLETLWRGIPTPRSYPRG